MQLPEELLENLLTCFFTKTMASNSCLPWSRCLSEESDSRITLRGALRTSNLIFAALRCNAKTNVDFSYIWCFLHYTYHKFPSIIKNLCSIFKKSVMLNLTDFPSTHWELRMEHVHNICFQYSSLHKHQTWSETLRTYSSLSYLFSLCSR